MFLYPGQPFLYLSSHLHFPVSCLAFRGVFYLLIRILTVVSCIVKMPPKVDLATRQALEAAASAQATEKRKKRLTTEVS